jgi:hypothetical protein
MNFEGDGRSVFQTFSTISHDSHWLKNDRKRNKNYVQGAVLNVAEMLRSHAYGKKFLQLFEAS